MTNYLYPNLTQLGKIPGGELQVAFALHNIIKLTRDPHISKFQIRSPNSKKKDDTFLYPLSLKKKQKNTKIKKILVTSTQSKGWMK